MRLLLDEMYPPRLAVQLRADGYDVLAVVELPDLVGRTDVEVARWARESDRVLVTGNVADFATMDIADHAGLLFVSARRWPRTSSGQPRLLTALRTWLGAHAGPSCAADSSAGLIEWL